MEHLYFAAAVAAVLGAFAVAGFVLFVRVWRGDGGLRGTALRATISVGTLLVLFLGLEIYFAGFYVASDGYGQTLAGRRWFQLYWNPINKLGYRDSDHSFADDSVVLVVGDSFVAGHGVANPDERLSGVIEDGLGAGWQVAVVAQNGWDPVQEYEGLVAYPVKPDRIVLSYYINDIESSARALGNAPPKDLLRMPPASIRWLVERSHAVNWFYWRVLRGEFGTIYWDWLKEAYGDPEVLEAHAKELEKFMAYAAEIGAELDFVVWPNLDYIEGSRPFTDRVVALLEERGASVLDLGTHFSGRDPSTLVANRMDGHPNPRIHAEVAGMLLESWKSASAKLAPR